MAFVITRRLLVAATQCKKNMNTSQSFGIKEIQLDRQMAKPHKAQCQETYNSSKIK